MLQKTDWCVMKNIRKEKLNRFSSDCLNSSIFQPHTVLNLKENYFTKPRTNFRIVRYKIRIHINELCLKCGVLKCKCVVEYVKNRRNKQNTNVFINYNFKAKTSTFLILFIYNLVKCLRKY